MAHGNFNSLVCLFTALFIFDMQPNENTNLSCSVASSDLPEVVQSFIRFVRTNQKVPKAYAVFSELISLLLHYSVVFPSYQDLEM